MPGDPLDLVPEAVVVLGPDRLVQQCNDRCGPLLGTPTSVVGRPIGEVVQLVTPAGRPCADPVPPRGTADRLAQQRFTVVLPDGRHRAVVMAGRWRGDGGIVLTFRRDDGAGAEADLVATVSHELRSPLASLVGFASALGDHGDELDDQQRRTFLAAMRHDAGRITRLMTELLEAARLDVGRTSLRRAAVDVAATVEEVVAAVRVRRLGEGRTIAVEIADGAPASLFVDRDRVVQVLTNLLDNALRHAPAATVAVTVRGTADGGLAVEVRDDGPGIDDAMHERVFHRFGRSRHAQRPGSGLGLYVSRGLARAHGGDLTLASRIGEGATFTLTLPPDSGGSDGESG